MVPRLTVVEDPACIPNWVQLAIILLAQDRADRPSVRVKEDVEWTAAVVVAEQRGLQEARLEDLERGLGLL